MEENNYKPFDKDTYTKIVSVVSKIKNSFDANDANFIWHCCTQIRGKQEKQPCTCGSAAGHWNRCIQDIRNWIDERNTEGE